MTFAMVSATVHFGINDETFVDNDGTVTFDVMFSIDNGEELAGFQFNLTGINILGASGGSAEAAGFTVNASANTVLGFNFVLFICFSIFSDMGKPTIFDLH